MEAETHLVVRKEIVVDRSREDAFRIFTTEMASWWPTATHSIYGDEVTDVIVEPEVGGRIYEVTKDGRSADWGKILEWDSPGGLTVSWKPNLDDEAHRTTWVVRFEGIDDAVTRVEVVHTGWEGFGEQAESARMQYHQGWDPVLAGYAGAL